MRHLNRSLQIDVAHFVGVQEPTGHPENFSRAFGARTNTSHPVHAEHNVLCGIDDRLTVGRAQDIVRRHHQHAGFNLRFDRKRHVNGHLVTVKVGVERRTNERMKLNRFSFVKNRLKRLNTKTVKSRCTIEKNRVLFHDVGENIPNFDGFMSRPVSWLA